MGNMSVGEKGPRGYEVQCQHPVLMAFRETMADVYRLQSDQGRVSRETSKVMLGFLTGATVALRVAGEGLWAQRFEIAARRLDQDWTAFARVVPELCADIERNTL